MIKPGRTVTFTNNDALPGQPESEQVWHSITSCRAPCNRGSGVGYPLANGPLEFDSGQLGFSPGLNRNVTIGSNSYTDAAAAEPAEEAARQELEAGLDLHVLLPAAPLHARLRPGARTRRCGLTAAGRR